MTISTPAFAADFEFKIGRASYTNYDRTSALVETTNTSGQNIRIAMITCAFMEQSGDVIDTNNFVISMMPAGESRYDKTSIAGKHDVSEVTCKPKNVSFD